MRAPVQQNNLKIDPGITRQPIKFPIFASIDIHEPQMLPNILTDPHNLRTVQGIKEAYFALLAKRLLFL